MALNDITFIKGQGGLGRPLEGQDYVSALTFYTANGNLPSGWTTSARTKALFSIEDAENAGILNDYADATAATATYLITTKGDTGDTIEFKYVGIAETLNLGVYTVATADSTIALQGAAWAAIINAGTYVHGCTASFTTATLTVTLPKSQGVFPNTGTPNSIVSTGAFAGTLTQNVIAGVASNQAVWHYQISEFFRIQPKGVLYTSFYPVPSTYDFSEIRTIQNFADGSIRQIGVWAKDKAYASGDLTAMSTEIVTYSDANHKPLSGLLAENFAAVTDLSTVTNLNTLTANKASIVLGQDGAGLGNFLWKHSGKSVPCLGACLGAVAFSAVSDDIAWVGKFNISNGIECDTPAFANGQLVKDVSQNLLTLLDNYRYIFLLKYVGLSGSYFNDSHTATVVSSDYAYIENNRTIDKGIRGIYSSVLPALASPLVLNSDGTLSDETIAYFTSLAEVNLNQMIRDVELSAFAVTIDPSQNVLSTNTLTIAVQLLPIGVARNITVKIGFTTKIA